MARVSNTVHHPVFLVHPAVVEAGAARHHGDLFVDRFNSKALASAYAAFNIFMALFTMGMGNFFAYQVAQAMIVKPPSAYTDRDRERIAMYHEFQDLKAQIESGKVEVGQTERFKYLDSLSKRKELQSFVSYLNPVYFFVSYSTVVGIYIVLGGLRGGDHGCGPGAAYPGDVDHVDSRRVVPHRWFCRVASDRAGVSLQRRRNNDVVFDLWRLLSPAWCRFSDCSTTCPRPARPRMRRRLVLG